MTSFYNLESFDEQEKNYEISLFNNQKNYTEKIDESVNESFPMMKSHREDDESFFEKNPQPDLYLNIKPKLPMDILLGENTDKKTKPNTITKTKKEKTEENEIKNDIPEPNNENIFSFGINDINNNNDINFEQNDIEPKSFLGKKKNRGRKKKEERYLDDSGHGKYSEDNIMRKIKTHLMDQIVIILNNSLNDKTNPFYKIDKEINENLKKDFNMQLMEKTIAKIFSETPISSKYKKNFDSLYNQKKIQKIFDENIEYNTIDLLQKKFIDMLKFIRENNLNEFLNSIKKKERKNPNVEEYLRSIKELFFNYENWFDVKKGRNRDKNKNIK
jgi:hypothetical protein